MAAGPMARDPAYYDDPLRFHGFRFCVSDAGQGEAGVKAENEYTSIEPGNLTWGSGRFTCPGRWYAGVLIKLLVAALLLEYDFQYPEGQYTRPPNIQNDVHITPDFAQMITVRRRQVSP